MASWTRSLLLASLLGSTLGTATACSSSEFAIAPSDPASGDSGAEGDSTAPSDASVESGPADPCAPQEGVAKLCVDVELARKEHPGYDPTTGAAALGIDGKGVVFAYLYAEDPGVAKGPKPSPVALLQYPPPEKIGEEVNVDTGLPLTLAGQAAPGEYWLVAGFQDNKTAVRTPERPLVAGDFVVVPVATFEGDVRYPKITVETGKTARTTAKLAPYREVMASVRLASSLHDYTRKRGIQGDGPVRFVVYDDDLSVDPKNATILDTATIPCIDLQAHHTSPRTEDVRFGTTVEGKHRLLAAVFDYGFPSTFPGDGTLLTPLDPAAMEPAIPELDVPHDSWVATVEAVLDSVPFPVGATDTVTCP